MRISGSSKRRIPINDAIEASEVRLVDKDGQQVGVVSKEQALAAATSAGLDLVLISEQAVPPVAKVMDYGKHVFEQKKVKADARKKQKRVQVKEIKFRPRTDLGDYGIKLRNLIRFLGSGNKAKVTLRFKGREIFHQELGMDVMRRIEGDLVDHGTLEAAPKMEGRLLSMVFAPKTKNSARVSKRHIQPAAPAANKEPAASTAPVAKAPAAKAPAANKEPAASTAPTAKAPAASKKTAASKAPTAKAPAAKKGKKTAAAKTRRKK